MQDSFSSNPTSRPDSWPDVWPDDDQPDRATQPGTARQGTTVSGANQLHASVPTNSPLDNSQNNRSQADQENAWTMPWDDDTDDEDEVDGEDFTDDDDEDDEDFEDDSDEFTSENDEVEDVISDALESSSDTPTFFSPASEVSDTWTKADEPPVEEFEDTDEKNDVGSTFESFEDDFDDDFDDADDDLDADDNLGDDNDLDDEDGDSVLDDATPDIPMPQTTRQPFFSHGQSPHGEPDAASVGMPGAAPDVAPDSSNPFAQPARPNLVGQLLLGRYRVLAQNDEGGFGTVSVCWDTRLQRRVAIKRMPLLVAGANPQTASTLADALGEARTSSMLAHPNIVTVYDFETDPTSSYLVMEYVDGLNLADLLARVEDGVLTYDECAHVLRSVAAALEFAHENGVLHLDIKPANIMIDRTGTVKLGDFGMSTLASAAGYGGARGGTVGYMPPEQIRGESVDERSDIFSLAVVVWEALAGTCPYRAATPQASLDKILRGPSPMLSKKEPELAGIVEETLLRAMSPNMVDRMEKVADLADPVVDNLGDAAEGQQSLRDLIEQAESGDDSPLGEEDDPGLSPAERYPWLRPTITRGVAALATCILSFRIIPYVIPTTLQAQVIVALVAGGCAYAWPPLGSALVLAALTLATSSQEGTQSMPVALVVGVLSIAWWMYAGRRSHKATAALLVPSCIMSPLTGPAIAGVALQPMRAAATGAASWLLCTFTQACWEVGFLPDALAESMTTKAADPTNWLIMVGCALASLCCSWIVRHEGKAFSVLGQVACFGIVALFQACLSHVENGGIWTPQAASSLAVALVLGVIMCSMDVLIGSDGMNPEGEDRR